MNENTLSNTECVTTKSARRTLLQGVRNYRVCATTETALLQRARNYIECATIGTALLQGVRYQWGTLILKSKQYFIFTCGGAS